MKRKFKSSLFLLLAGFVAFNSNVNSITINAKAAKTGVAINATNFPDKNFRTFIKAKYDKNKDGRLSQKEINTVKTIQIDGNKIKDLKLSRAAQDIKSLKGLRKFTNLQKLVVVNAKIKTLQLDNPKLSSVDITCKNMTEFRLSGGANLKSVTLSEYKATDKLNLHKYKNLERLTIYPSKTIRYKNMGIEKCKKLKVLNLRNKFSAEKINLAGFTQLEDAYIGGNVKKVSAKNIRTLKSLEVESSSLNEISVAGCRNLEWLNCVSDKLKTLNVKNLNKLSKVFCSKKTTVTGVSSNTKVTYM